jgi:hypothetical protein
MKLTYSHILAVFFAANDAERLNGRRWYADARDIACQIAADLSLSVETVASVIAALSPNNRWERNVVDARQLCTAFSLGGADDAAQIKTATFNANKTKALRILSGAAPLTVLSGLKVRAFYACIMGDSAAVCIDGHAYSVWQGERIPTTQTPKISPRLYSAIAADYSLAARIVSDVTGCHYSGAQLQAVTWVAWRRIARGAAE